MTCACSDPIVEPDERQLNEDERQVTRTCVRCGTVLSNEIVVIRQW